jgi:hypothetical protein
VGFHLKNPCKQAIKRSERFQQASQQTKRSKNPSKQSNKTLEKSQQTIEHASKHIEHQIREVSTHRHDHHHGQKHKKEATASTCSPSSPKISDCSNQIVQAQPIVPHAEDAKKIVLVLSSSLQDLNNVV